MSVTQAVPLPDGPVGTTAEKMGAVASRPTSKSVSQRASASAVLPGAPISRSARRNR